MSSRLASRICLACEPHKHQFLRPNSLSRHLRKASQVLIPQHLRRQSTWADTINSAQKLVQDPSPPPTSKLPPNFPFPSIVNPLKLVAPEMTTLTGNIRMLLGSAHPTLAKVAKYYISSEGGKHIRPLIVLLVSKALSHSRSPSRTPETFQTDQDVPISPLRVLNDDNPDSRPPEQTPEFGEGITPSQRRLAEITEMIHAASLLHDDVIDASLTRRNNPSCVSMFGNKMSILGGDFLLGRASVALARLRNAEVIELLATVIANLVEGEFMQLKNLAKEGGGEQESAIDYYLRKTYLKTASLISKSCRAAAVLGGASAELTDSAYSFGRNLGLAFQLVDDMLDYTAPATILGKPTNADLALGLATAPVLFAWKDHPELGPMIKRKFGTEGDVERARELVAASDGLEKTRELATEYSSKALEALHYFPECEERVALEKLTRDVLTRKK